MQESSPNQFTEKDLEQFALAASRRDDAMRWDALFPDGANDIVLPLDGAEARSADMQIEAAIAAHNAEVEAAKETSAKGFGRDWKQRQLRRSAENLTQLENFNPYLNRWESKPFITEFLDVRDEWLLREQFKQDRKREGLYRDDKKHPARKADIAHTKPLAVDQFLPESLRVVISRDPQKIAEMSTGQRWWSCMGRGKVNYHYVTADIERGTLVAYLVAEDDLEAHHPLMRQLLKPFHNEEGKTILIPAHCYGAEYGGSDWSRDALDNTLKKFVRESVNQNQSGSFKMDPWLYADGQATTIQLNKVWESDALAEAIKAYIAGAYKEWTTEWANANGQGEKQKRCLRKLKGLLDPKQLAYHYYLSLTHTSLGGEMPTPEMVRHAVASPRVAQAMLECEPAIRLLAEDEAAFFKALDTLKPDAIDLSELPLGPKQMRMLCTMLEQHSYPHALNLKNCSIGAGIVMLADSLRVNTSLTSLCLAGNGEIGVPFMEALCNMLKQNTTLAVLDICNCSIGEMRGALLAKGLAHNSGLVKLDVRNNAMGTENSKAVRLAATNGRNKNLLVLQKDGNVLPELTAYVDANYAAANRWVSILEKPEEAAQLATTKPAREDIASRYNAIRYIAEERGILPIVDEQLAKLQPQPQVTNVANRNILNRMVQLFGWKIGGSADYVQ